MGPMVVMCLGGADCSAKPGVRVVGGYL